MRAIVSAAVVFLAALSSAPGILSQGGPVEAPTGFDVASNGFAEEFCANQDALTNSPNSPLIPADECNFDAAAEEFTGPETVADGLGPIFNAAGCGECHLVPILGGGSQIMEKRAGFFTTAVFIEHPGGSLIQDRATDRADLRRLRIRRDTNVVALAREHQRARRRLRRGDRQQHTAGHRQRAALRRSAGSSSACRCSRRPGQTRVGRFGWKNQQASLVSFSADAYVNEMGITSPLQPTRPTSNGASVADYDHVPPEPERSGRRRRGRGAVRAVHALDHGAAGRRRSREYGATRRPAARSSIRSAAASATRGRSSRPRPAR